MMRHGIGEHMMTRDLLAAIEFATNGQWSEAHGIVQRYETDRKAAWIHAVLHKIEGDLVNSRYWYRRAGKMECVDQEPNAELLAIKSILDAPED